MEFTRDGGFHAEADALTALPPPRIYIAQHPGKPAERATQNVPATGSRIDALGHALARLLQAPYGAFNIQRKPFVVVRPVCVVRHGHGRNNLLDALAGIEFGHDFRLELF